MRLPVLIAATLLAGCPISARRRGRSLESRLFIPFDNQGHPAVDSLRFHWPRTAIPVRYWVEDSVGAPALVRNAIATWKIRHSSTTNGTPPW